MPVQQPTPTLTTNTTENPNKKGRGRGTGRVGRGGRSGYGEAYRQWRENNLRAIINTYRDFEWKISSIGVIGLPSEQNLRNGLQLGEFSDSVMNHVGTYWEKVNDLKYFIQHLQHPEKYIAEPPDIAPNKETDPGRYEKWKNKVTLHDKWMDNLNDNKVKLYNLIFGQCSPNMEIEICSDKKFTRKDWCADALWLLKIIKKIALGVTLCNDEAQT